MSLDFEKIYDMYFSKIYNYIYYCLLNKQNTEVLVGEIFFIAAEELDKYDGSKDTLTTWIFTIAINSLDNFIEAEKMLVPIDSEENPSGTASGVTAESTDIMKGRYKTVHDLLDTLDNRSRRILALKLWSGLTNREISKLLKINESVVSTICSRGLKKLKLISDNNRLNLGYISKITTNHLLRDKL